MKVSIEQKAKAYDEALERAIAWREKYVNSTISEDGTMIKDFDNIFPQLAESKDEKVRKAIYNCVKWFGFDSCFFKDVSQEECLAWLEKQKATTSNKDIERMRNVAINACKYMVDNFENSTKDYEDAIAWLKKQGEHKPADKVEPKFKVGDWVVNNNGEPQFSQVIARSWPDSKIKRTTNNFEIFINTATLDKQYHLWTIQDAKDGDVLVNDFHLIFILKEIKNNTFVSHCSVIERGNDVITNSIAEREVGDSELVKVYPATQEQRSKLFLKMAEEGYEWYSDKKELRKVEHTAWSEEDERIYQSIMDDTVQENQLNDKQTNWLSDIKYRYFPQPKQEWSEEDKEFINDLIGIFDGQQYQAHSDEEIVKWLKSIRLLYNKEWDENDEEMLKSIIATCELACEDRDSSPARHLLKKQTNWLKSLRPQSTWKPSEAQMVVLNDIIINGHLSNANERIIKGLQEQLKKLREE